MTFEVPSFTNS